jgi:bifunctional UDP-N-acetylglucosamine pyrophosphorylase/glucosamine-1-phosphate N-acetyltransferase
MANALSLAAPYIHGPFIMSACDNLTPTEHVAELLKTHQAEAADATLSLMQIDLALAGRTGIVEWHNGQIRRIVEKPAPGEAPSNIASLPCTCSQPSC